MKKILVLTAVMFAAVASQASYLYWQVTPSSVASYADKDVNFASLFVTDGSSSTRIAGTQLSSSSTQAMSLQTSDISSYKGDQYSFYVELAHYDAAKSSFETHAVTAQPVSYASLLDDGYIQVDSMMKIPFAWTGGPYTVPEPTSGMMILLGLAALALKRR